MTNIPQSSLHPVLAHWIAFVKAHEKLLIIVLGALLAFHFYGDVLNFISERDKRHVALDQQIAVAAQQKAKDDNTQNQQLLQQLSDLKSQLATVSAQAQANIQKRAQDTNAQKQKNNNSTSSEVATRTSVLLRVEPTEVVADNASGALTFSQAAGHANVNALEESVKAEADALDLNKELAVCTAVGVKQDETIVGLNKGLADERSSHVADVNKEQAKTQLAKDEGNKKWRSGFKYGAIVGFIGGVITLRKL